MLFVWWEAHAAEPSLPLRLFTDRSVSAIYAMNFMQMFAITTVSTFLPLFLQMATGVTTKSGLQIVPQSVMISVTAAVCGNVVSRIGR